MRSAPSKFNSLAGLLAFGAIACGAKAPASDGGTSGPPSLGPLGGRILTTNQADGTLSVVDPDNGAFVGPLLVPIVEEQNMEMPHEISADPLGRFFVIGLMEMPADDRTNLTTASEIEMMNSTLPGWALELAADGTLLGKVQVDPDPGDNALSADGTTAYVSCFNQPEVIALENQGDQNLRDMDGNLWVIDSARVAPLGKLAVCPEPHVLELSPDGRRLFVTCLNDEVAVLDISTPGAPSLIARVSEDRLPDGGTFEALPSEAVHGPYALQPSPADADGGYTVWVSDGLDRTLEILDAQSLTFVARIQMTSLPLFATFSADGTVVYVAHQQPDGIAIFDAASATQRGDLSLPASDCIAPHQILLSGDGKTGAVLCEGDHLHGGQYVRLDLTSGTVISSTTIGIYPVEMTLLPPPGG
ncbi:MAG: YncE family protein [Myxococcales bacterium]